LGSVNVTSGTLHIGQAGVGSYLSTLGGLNLTGTAVLAASPSTSATIVGCVNDFSSASNTYSGVISGASSVLTLDAAAGTLTLANTAASAYGGIVVQAGTLKVATTAALSNNALTIDGGTLDLGGWSKFTLTALAGSGGFVESSSGTMALTFNPSTESDYSGSIVNGKGPVSLIKTGVGTLILAGSDTYTGETTVTGGLLELGSPAALPSGAALSVGADAALIFDSSLLSGDGQASVSPRPRPWVHGARGEGQGVRAFPLPYSGEGHGVRAFPFPYSGDGQASISPLASGEGQASISPLPYSGEGQASIFPLPYSGEGQGVRAFPLPRPWVHGARGPVQGVLAVPEPGTLVLLLAAALWSAAIYRRFLFQRSRHSPCAVRPLCKELFTTHRFSCTALLPHVARKLGAFRKCRPKWADGTRRVPATVRSTDLKPLERNKFRSTQENTAASRGSQSGDKSPHSKTKLRERTEG
jgi:autotransporter-associated beta strand protein